VRVFDRRAEQVDEPGHHDCLSARALGSLAQLIGFGGHLLKPDGRLLAMKGQWPEEELAACRTAGRLSVPAGCRCPRSKRMRHLLV
jgi:16S rRNA (guanine527-N7)-methyltransferase